MDFINSTQFALTELSIIIILINLFISFTFCIVIGWVYQRTHRGVSYSRSFVESLIIIGVLSAVIMMILNDNLIRALGILGIFTLVRFRTIIKDTKDAAYLIFSIVIGLAVGTSNYSLSAASLVFISVVILLLAKSNFGSRVKGGFILTCVTDNNFNFKHIENIFPKFLHRYNILQIKSKAGKERTYFLSIEPKNYDKMPEMIDELSAQDGVKLVDLLTSKETSEY